jgi:hypothetical protein
MLSFRWILERDNEHSNISPGFEDGAVHLRISVLDSENIRRYAGVAYLVCQRMFDPLYRASGK